MHLLNCMYILLFTICHINVVESYLRIKFAWLNLNEISLKIINTYISLCYNFIDTIVYILNILIISYFNFFKEYYLQIIF